MRDENTIRIRCRAQFSILVEVLYNFSLLFSIIWKTIENIKKLPAKLTSRRNSFYKKKKHKKKHIL